MSTEFIVAAAAVAAALIALAQIVFTVKSIRDQLWIATFSEYTARYLNIVRDLPSDLRTPRGGTLDDLPPDERGRVLNSVRAYLNLCSEEFYLHNRGVLDKETWKIWSIGIRDTLKLPWVMTSWPVLRAEYDGYPQFCEFIEAFLFTYKPPEQATRRGAAH